MTLQNKPLLTDPLPKPRGATDDKSKCGAWCCCWLAIADVNFFDRCLLKFEDFSIAQSTARQNDDDEEDEEDKDKEDMDETMCRPQFPA